jgi:hypothetical protein
MRVPTGMSVTGGLTRRRKTAVKCGSKAPYMAHGRTQVRERPWAAASCQARCSETAFEIA